MAWFKCIGGGSGPEPQPTTLPYIPSEDVDNNPPTIEEIESLKAQIDEYNSQNSITPINWGESYYTIFKTAGNAWYDWSHNIPCLAYFIIFYRTPTLTMTWSQDTTFENFELNNSNRYLQDTTAQQLCHYTIIRRSIGDYINRENPYIIKQYFGAKTPIHIQNDFFDFTYYENYPIFSNVVFSTTDSQNVTQPFLKNGNYTLFACGSFTTGSTRYEKNEIDCGFQPDYVEVKMEFGNGYTYANAYMESRGTYGKSFWDLRPIEDNVYELQLGSTEGETGISDITSTGFKYRVNGNNTQNKACTYKAMKFI